MSGIGRTRSRSASPPRSKLESCIPAVTDAPHTFRAGCSRGAFQPTPSDLVWEKMQTNRVQWRRERKKEVSQKKETLANNLDALARHVRQEAARYRENEELRAHRKASHLEFLAREKLDPSGAGGFFASAQGGGLKTLGVGQKGKNTRDRGHFDTNMHLLRLRTEASKISVRHSLWLSGFRECPVCFEQCIDARDIVRGVVVPHEVYDVPLEHLPSCGKTLFTCRNCEWSTEFVFDDSASPRYPETRLWQRPATAARPRWASAEREAAACAPSRRTGHANADDASTMQPTITAPEGQPGTVRCKKPGSEEQGGEQRATSPFGILLSTPCHPSPLDKMRRKSLSPQRVPRHSEQDGESAALNRKSLSPIRSASMHRDSDRKERPASAMPAGRRQKLSSANMGDWCDSNFSASAPSLRTAPPPGERTQLVLCAPSKLNDIPTPSQLLSLSHKVSWAASRISRTFFHEDSKSGPELEQPAEVTRDSTGESRSGNVFLSLSKPPKIVQACREWQKLMQLDKDKCLGRTLALITGQETDMCLLDSLVHCTQARGWLSLYPPITGRKVLCGLQAKLVEQTGARTTCAPHVCKLTMSPCTHALDCKTLMSDEHSSMLIVKVAKPHYIVHASKSFCIAYGFGNVSIVGHTAQVLLGPTSDATLWNETIEKALDCEREGQMSRCELDLFNCYSTPVPSSVALQLCVGDKLLCRPVDCPVLLVLKCTPKTLSSQGS